MKSSPEFVVGKPYPPGTIVIFKNVLYIAIGRYNKSIPGDMIHFLCYVKPKI